jgi:hypothetical protein
MVSQSTKQRFLILSDSSCLVLLLWRVRNLENPLVGEIMERVHQQLYLDPRITCVWIPSHMPRVAAGLVEYCLGQGLPVVRGD